VTADDGAQHGARRHHCSVFDGHRHRFVGGPQSVRVLHRHHTPAREQPGVHDGPGRRGEHRGTGVRGQVHAAVTRAEPVRRLPERHRHVRRRSQRPAVSGGCRCGSSRSGGL